MENKEIAKAVELITQQRWAALATVKNGEPYASMVAYVASADLGHLYLHLSTLAPHTQKLLRDPAISLVVSEQDVDTDDPQTLARLSLQGKIEVMTEADDDYAEARQRYIERLPNSEMLFNFSDFSLFRVTTEKLRYVGGFAKAFSLSPEELQQAAN